MFWIGKDHMSASSDYLALGMRNGHLQFSYNLGSGEVVIRYDKSRLDDGLWHQARAQRYVTDIAYSSPGFHYNILTFLYPRLLLYKIDMYNVFWCSTDMDASDI